MSRIYFFLLFYLSSFLGYAQSEMWGTVVNGGNNGFGYIYRVNSTGDNLEIVHHFSNTDGRGPSGKLLLASNGKLYGLTPLGGQYNGGVLYEYDPDIDSFQVLYHFTLGNIHFPHVSPDANSGLIEVSPGVLMGNIIYNSISSGKVFSFTISTRTISTAVTIPNFYGGAFNMQMGNYPNGPLYKASDGYLYGTTARNSQCLTAQPNQGSFIRINPSNNAYSVLYLNPCTSVDGQNYLSYFIEENGKLYSIALAGTHGHGVIYEFDPSSNTYTKKYDFEGGVQGKNPSPMVKADNGKFYGTAFGGTPHTNVPGGGGIIFEFNPSTGVYTKKNDFFYTTDGFAGVGINPFNSPLVKGSNGKLYGKTSNGIFEYDILTNQTRPAGRYPWFGVNPSNPSLMEFCRKPSYQYRSQTTFEVCEGTPFSYDLQCNNAASVVWKHDGTTETSQTSTSLTFTDLTEIDLGTWYAELTNECGTTTTQSIYLIMQEKPTISLNSGALQSSEGLTYQWIDCETSNIIPDETQQAYTPLSNGSYAVTVKNNLNCSSTSDCYSFTISGTKPFISDSDILFFPNPASNQIEIQTEEFIKSVIISDASGQPVLETNSGKIDISFLDAGIYFIKIDTNKGIWRNRFVKQ